MALIQEMGGYIAGAGGKRLRPILLLLAARLAGYVGPRSVRLACVVELLHTATLIHDDVVDQAPLRRGRPSANAQWGDDAVRPRGRPPVLEVVRYARARQRSRGDGDPRALDGLDDRGRGLPARAQAERRHDRGGLPPDHHAEDRLLHLRVLPHRRAARRPAGRTASTPSRGTGWTSASRSRSPTTRSTSSPIRIASARRSAPTSARGSARCRSSRCWRAQRPPRPSACRASSSATPSTPRRSTRSGGYVVEHDGVEYALARAHGYAQAAKAAPRGVPAVRGARDRWRLIADFVVDRDR